MGNRSKRTSDQGGDCTGTSVRGIIQEARGGLTQTEFVKLLDKQHGIKTSQGLISKYESGKVNPPTAVIDSCIKIIHDENILGEVSLNDLEESVRRVLTGPAKAEARKAFAVILDRLF